MKRNKIEYIGQIAAMLGVYFDVRHSKCEIY